MGPLIEEFEDIKIKETSVRAELKKVRAIRKSKSLNNLKI